MNHLDIDYKLNQTQIQYDISELLARISVQPTSYKITEVHTTRDATVYGNIILNNPCMINKFTIGLD